MSSTQNLDHDMHVEVEVKIGELWKVISISPICVYYHFDENGLETTPDDWDRHAITPNHFWIPCGSIVQTIAIKPRKNTVNFNAIVASVKILSEHGIGWKWAYQFTTKNNYWFVKVADQSHE